MLARALRRRAALARRAIGVETLACWAVVEVHIHHGKKSLRILRVCRLVVSRLLFARRSARSEPSSHSAHRDGRRRSRGAGAGAGAGACGSSGRVVLAAAVEQRGELVTSRCAMVFNDTTANGTARADANAESVEEADR